ncbi:phosphopantetheine-binding protein [Blastococcus sp. CCUG 61487]|uniref:acyl carrier protein n=1 Tax=Blastococcus sp. CCUG 61487 TaxID=1840703 RepID=UPI001BB05A43|nr:phosphopantetheine-binding protein [Blastococcus sp. CCUG 61487]
MVKAMDETRLRIREMIRDIAPNGDGWRGDDPQLVVDLEYHSLALVELAFALEDEFGVEPIDEHTAATIVSVSDVEGYVMQALDASPGQG